MVWRALGVFGGLDPTPTAHIWFSASFLHLCLSPGARISSCLPDKCCPTFMTPPSPATPCSFSQQALSSNPWLAPQLQVFETYTSATLSPTHGELLWISPACLFIWLASCKQHMLWSLAGSVLAPTLKSQPQKLFSTFIVSERHSVTYIKFAFYSVQAIPLVLSKT